MKREWHLQSISIGKHRIPGILVLIAAVLFLNACKHHIKKQQLPKGKTYSYRIEEEEVVFEFDRREYNEVTSEAFPHVTDFEDIDIYKVTVSGDFNAWSKDGWTMHKVSKDVFQLRKKLCDFDDKFQWQFKFVINDSLWAEPPADAVNQVRVQTEFGYQADNLVMETIPPSLEGNTTFILKGFEQATRIFLSGEFNSWSTNMHLFGREKGEWVCRIDLKPGKYQYKFIVDGEWMIDPANPNSITTTEGYVNSVLEIPKRINSGNN